MTQNTDLEQQTNSLAIAGVVIRQDLFGRYRLNDLHKAAGGEKRHNPNYWTELQQTQELVAILESEHRENSDTVITASEQNQPLRIVKGGNGVQGTFVVKELVYAYAMWISAKFNITVIRAYDALVNNKPPYGLKEIPHQAYCPTVLTEKMCGHIQERVNELSRIEGVHYNTKYRELKDEFRCNTYTELPVTKYADICVFLDCLPIYPIPEYIMIEGNELREMRIARRELEDFKANPALLPCGENELWTKCTNDDVIIPYSQFEQMNALIESHQNAKNSIAQSIKQAFDEIDTTSDNILVGRQRWNELNFIVKKVMNNPQALAIL